MMRYDQTPEAPRNDIYCRRDSIDLPLDYQWDDVCFIFKKQKSDMRPRAFSIQSPMFIPQFIGESPALMPIKFSQIDDGYELMDRRKSSIANESDLFGIRKGTGDPLELARFSIGRRESINPMEFSYDKDGFKRPKEMKNGNEDAQDPNKRQVIDMNQQIRMSPIMQPEDRKDNIRLLTTMNPAVQFSPLQMPIMNQVILAPPYPADGMQWIQPGNFGYPNECVRKGSDCGLPVNDGMIDNMHPGYRYSPFVQPTMFRQTPRQSMTSQIVPANQQDEFRLDAIDPNPLPTSKPVPTPTPPPVLERRVGSLTISERKNKVQKYLEKRKRRIWKKKVSYDCRKKVADKRLRIKGRFVTKEQACAILGTTLDDLAKNELLRNLVTNNDNCSIVTATQNMKIRNIQT